MIRFLLLVSALGLCALTSSQTTAPESNKGLGAVAVVAKPERNSIQYYLDEIMKQGDLFAKALKVSGIYDTLTPDRYPFTLFFVRSADSGGQLERYLTQQGLTPESFLHHPKLRQFLESHLIMHYVNTQEPRPKGKRRVVVQAVSGYEITFSSQSTYYQKEQEYYLRFANGLSFGSECLFSGLEISTPEFRKLEGQICFVNKPVVKDFDWSLAVP